MVQPRPLRWSDPEISDAAPDSFFELAGRIKRLTQRGADHECWTIALSNETSGRPQISWRGRKYRAARLVYFLERGELAPGRVVRHLCGNPQCVNPAHLMEGSYSDNAADEVKWREQLEGRTPPDESYYLRVCAEWDALWRQLLPPAPQRPQK